MNVLYYTQCTGIIQERFLVVYSDIHFTGSSRVVHFKNKLCYVIT